MVRPIKISVIAEASRARQEVSSLGATLKRNLGGKVGFGLLAAGAGALVKSAIDVEKSFSTSMRMIQANTKAPAAEMDKLNKLAIKLGADTSFSANEAADAMLELAKAGIDTKTIMGGGLSGTLQLAAAGGVDLANASTIAANAMQTFGLSGKDMASISAALAGGANASTASVESLGQALQQVGPGATNAGLSLQETVAALAAFDSAGIKGSDAGTSLKTMLARLVPTTKAAREAMFDLGLDFTNADGTFKSLTQIAGQLQSRMKTLAPAQRQVALNAIFGSDATRAATVLMKEGASGIRSYIKATNDQEAAQKAAKARMDGTAGALERLSGSIETAQLKLGQELAPLTVKVADAIGDNLVPAMDTGIRAVKDLAKAASPAVSEISEALGHLGGEGEGVGRVFNDVLIPAVRTTSEVIGALVDFVDNLPGPVKEVGLQAGIAALVFPRLAAGVSTATAAMTLQIAKLQQLRAEMTYTATRSQITGAAMSRLGVAAKAAAGIGGMVALTQGSQQSNIAVSTLLSTLGGAASGFAVGGPIGALVGGLGGLATAALSTNEAAKESMTTWQTYASTLNSVTGATTEATRAMVVQELQQRQALSAASQLGISKSTLIDGILGQAKARDQLAAAIKREQAQIDELGKKAQAETQKAIEGRSKLSKEQLESLGNEYLKRKTNLDILKAEVGEVKKSADAKREEIAILKGLPESVVTQIQTPGAVDSAAEIANLAAQFRLTPKQIRTIIEMSGVSTSVKQVQTLKGELQKAGKVKIDNAWAKAFGADIDAAKGRARSGMGLLNGELAKAGNARPNIAKGPFGRGVSGDLSALIAVARGKATGVGSNLGNGMYSGMGPWIAPIAQRAREMVAGAVAAANAAAAIRSPSRKTAYTGDMLGAGLANGLQRSKPKAKGAGAALMAAVLAGVVRGSDGVEKAIELVNTRIEKSITGKNQSKREAALKKTYAGMYAALRKNAAAQDAVNDKLEQARDRVKDLVAQYRDYSRAIRDSITATGDVTQLGKQEDGTVSLTSLLNDLRNRVNDAKRFSSLLQSLAAKGLSRTAIQQMLDAGPEAALATAEAIASGGASAIAQINALQGQLAATGTQLGDDMARRYYTAGVRAAQGVVAGLEAQAKNLDRSAIRLANALVAAVKKALKIKSPSRVFMGIGDNVVKGLDIGLDDTYAKRSGATLAASLQKGFGTPALDAMSSIASSGAQPMEFQFRLSAEQMSQMEKGREVVANATAYFQAGGRAPTGWGRPGTGG